MLKLQEGENRNCSWTVTVIEVRQTVAQIHAGYHRYCGEADAYQSVANGLGITFIIIVLCPDHGLSYSKS